jgi:hypothetical protein
MATLTPERRGQLARLDALFERLAELQGQRNAIDAEIVDVVAALDEDDLWGVTGARSLESCVAWKTGSSASHAAAMAAVARRAEELPRCVEGLRSGSLSLDQVAVIAERAGAGPGVDEHYAELAESATVAQLRKALSLAPRPKADPPVEPERSVTKLTDEEFAYWRIKLPHVDAAVFDAALQSHHDALVAEWKRDREAAGDEDGEAPPFPTVADAFLRLVEHGWDADVAARPHGNRTTVVLHLDVESKLASLHLGPALSEAERRYLCCDAKVETWFERDGKPIGVGRTTREIPRRLRRALERRHPTCAVPGCGATRGLHAHHIWHWEDGGPTELWNLVLVCPFHHRLHHRGLITISGPGHRITVSDVAGRALDGSSVARPPTLPAPPVPPYRGPTGERADWKWYEPFAPRVEGAQS